MNPNNFIDRVYGWQQSVLRLFKSSALSFGPSEQWQEEGGGDSAVAVGIYWSSISEIGTQSEN